MFFTSWGILTIAILQIVDGKSITPELGFGSGYIDNFRSSIASPVEFEYFRKGFDDHIGTFGSGKIGYDGVVGSPLYAYNKVDEGAFAVPKAPGIGFSPQFSFGYGHGHDLGYNPKGYFGPPKEHLVYHPHSGLYPGAAGIERKIYGYGHYPFITHDGVYGHGYGAGHKILHHPVIEESSYDDGKKFLVGSNFVKKHGENGDSLAHDDSGYEADKVAVKDVKGDSVHFVDTDSATKAHHNGKEYHGGHHFDKEGKSGSERHEKQGHRKGHNIKGFKKSHHLDETGKTEEYFDEVHDEGGNYAFDGHSGKSGESGGSSFKGGIQDGKYAAGENKKEGYFDNEYIVDKEKAGSGKFGGNNFASNHEAYGHTKELGDHHLSGNDYTSELKKYPSFI